MAFLNNLSKALLSSIGLEDNDQFNIDEIKNLAQQIDVSEQRRYLEDGRIRFEKPRSVEIFLQEPDITVLIKKKQFSSLAENYRYDLMNDEEKLFIRASKRLFQNKCKLIAAYERLSKIEKVGVGIINDFVLSAIFQSLDAINQLNPSLLDAKTQATFDTIRKIKNFSDPNFFTTWIVDKKIPFATDVGEGTGVIELTTISSMDSTTSTIFGGGNAGLAIEDPYKILVMTNEDIERAISEASNFFQNNAFFNFTESGLNDAITTLKSELNQTRQNRNAFPIIFSVDPYSLTGKKVRAIIDEEGRELFFNFNSGLLGIGGSVETDAGAFLGHNGLQGTEIELFNQIVKNIYILLGLEASTRSEIKEFNQQTNYVRRQMKLQFGGKCMIQPLDEINVFISSKTVLDSRISKGLNNSFSSKNLQANLNQSIGQLESSLDDLENFFSSDDQSYLVAEKNSIAGEDFPTWLWYILRNNFTRQAAGRCVFSGIVENAGHNYDNGKYTVRVSASDKCHYLKFGQININPSVDVFNSDIYDPLTPFKLDFDASSGFIRGEIPPLLDENIRLLNSGSVKAKSGRFRGLTLDEQTYQIQDADQVASRLFRRKLNDPDGFVYRWKQGIGSFTLFGEPHASGTFRSQASPSLTADPFAGQDVMNVLSLLITGKPYNFNNFMRAAIAAGNLSREELTNGNGNDSFFRGLVNDLIKQNQTWGNFLPFKKLVINDSGYAFLRSGEFDITTTNTRLSELLRQRAARFDELTTIIPQFANNPQFYKSGTNNQLIVDNANNLLVDIPSVAKLGEDIIRLDFQIQQIQNDFNRHLQSANLRQADGTIRIFGDDISFDPDLSFGNSAGTEEQRIKDRQEFRRKIDLLTQRKLWQIKANEDRNLFIVDDSYDKNYDIQGFEQALTNGLSTFKSTYTNVFDRVNGVAQILGLEIFADTQGNIQARPPQYNRIPSSVFYKMIKNKHDTGIQIFPQYLESLFFNQVQGLTDQLEIIEDEIRIRAAALGAINDDQAKRLLNGSSLNGGQGERDFRFLTSEADGKFGSKDVRLLLIQSNPDFAETTATRALNSLLSTVQTASNTTINFDIVQRIRIVNPSNEFAGITLDNTNVIDKIGLRLQQKKGSDPPKLKDLLSTTRILNGAGQSQLDKLNLTDQIAQFISERQYVIKLLFNSLKNLNQGIEVNNNTGQSILYPYLNKKNSIPAIIEHMIEDENYDDVGYNSSKRYILTDSKIISLSISEHPPDYTLIEVDGQLASGLVPLPGSLGGISSEGGGNAIATAFAVDYDMWRMYGFRAPHTVNVPFLSDPDSQCAPYAVFLLNLARKNIFQANASVAGNEFIQPGEVYYIEDRDLLFYAESVSHNFSYGGQFTTTLNLKYGRNPGEYIPTVLDIIGKGLYTNRNQSSLIRHVRHGNSDDSTPIASLIIDENKTGIDSLIGGKFGDQNRKSLGNMMLATTGLLTPNGGNKVLKIQIRIYHNSVNGIAADSNLQAAANSVKEWLANPSQVSLFPDGVKTLPDTQNNPLIDPNLIDIITIDLGDQNITESPSNTAWNFSRTVSANTSTDINLDIEQVILFTNILDIWAVFEDFDETIIAQPVATDDQASIEAQDQYIASFNKALGI